ncbi:zinc ABC transporter substrate-binding protein [Vibrio sp. Of7-15]|uniref:metal ABC transporter solute-binding protein, Zn/Mn family n=1 Tax=Vibrio sp. Of7-15 TaxID=2724879 RepID=UPI001EF280E6|nr:zinc ABC transporter substrate-binding protein [Vibrio sp. Of7-15]MCG7496037.1 zinc ABC transporter substrate-binding protein [Vibrio sp. Of7-15]
MFTFINKRVLALSMVIGSVLPAVVNAADVLTSTPTTYMLASQLLDETSITVSQLTPKRYGLHRQPNWFDGKGAEFVAQAAKEAEVVISMKSVWAQDPIYDHTRMSNIRLIEVDASQAISPRAESVASIKQVDGAVSPYVWLNPANLVRMTNIIASDLVRVWPEHQQKIRDNQRSLSALIRNQQRETSAKLASHQVDAVIVLNESLMDYSAGHNLFVVDALFKPELEWSEQEKNNLRSQLKEDPTLWLLTTRKPSAALKQLLGDFSQYLVVDPIDRWGRGIDGTDPLARWQSSLM